MVRTTEPSASRFLSVVVSIFCEISGMAFAIRRIAWEQVGLSAGASAEVTIYHLRATRCSARDNPGTLFLSTSYDSAFPCYNNGKDLWNIVLPDYYFRDILHLQGVIVPPHRRSSCTVRENQLFPECKHTRGARCPYTWCFGSPRGLSSQYFPRRRLFPFRRG